MALSKTLSLENYGTSAAVFGEVLGIALVYLLVWVLLERKKRTSHESQCFDLIAEKNKIKEQREMSSQLREQLRGIIDGLSEEANKNHDREIKERYYFLRSVIKSKQSVTRACARAGQSTDSFNRWGKRLKKLRTLLALKSYSRKPRRSPMQLSKKVERKVIALRNAEPAHGPERIGFDLKKLFNFDVHTIAYLPRS